MALLQKGYLGATPLFRNIDWFQNDARKIVSQSANAGTTITANTAAHTKGSWTQVIASTAGDCSLLAVLVSAVGANATDTATLIDIGTGASGSETSVASNIAVGGASNASGGFRAGVLLLIPLKIPSGTRLSARIQSVVTGGKTASVLFYAIDTGDYATAPTSVDVIGSDTATSKGTSFSGASGTWVEATASTSQAYRAICVVPSIHDGNVVTANRDLSVGVGASGSEVEFGTVRHETSSTELSSVMPPYSVLFGRNIPAGSRLAVKHAIAADPSKYGFCLIGIP